MSNWDVIRRDWENSKLTLAELAEKHNVKLGSLKSKKSRDAKDGDPWERGGDVSKTKVATKPKKVATKSKKDATKRSADADSSSAAVEEEVGNGDLTDKQRLFIANYIKYWNAGKAYQKSYQCSKETASTNGPRLLRNARIREEIIKARDALTEDTLLDKRILLQKWMDIAFADMTDFTDFGTEEREVLDEMGNVAVDEDGNPKMYTVNYVRFHNAEEVDGTIISEVKQGKDGISVKLADRMKALEYLTKHFDLLSETEREKYQIAKAKADAELAQIAVNKENGTQDEYEDDGFMEALKGTEVNWDE